MLVGIGLVVDDRVLLVHTAGLKSHRVQSVVVIRSKCSSSCWSGGARRPPPYLQHELAVVPPHEDHLPGQAMARPAAAHQEPGSQTHLCPREGVGVGELTFDLLRHTATGNRDPDAVWLCTDLITFL